MRLAPAPPRGRALKLVGRVERYRQIPETSMTEHSHDHPHGHDHGHDHEPGHGHSHGIVDPSIATSERGLWAIKWSFHGLAATALLQLVVVFLTGSVALLADTIHN